MSLVNHLAVKYGISGTMVQALGRDLIEGLHREAVMDGPSNAVVTATLELGNEASFHLWGLLMTAYDSGLKSETSVDAAASDWAEFLQRFNHRACLYGRIMELWRYDREQNELDAQASRASRSALPEPGT
jgi:hypothetical protein